MFMTKLFFESPSVDSKVVRHIHGVSAGVRLKGLSTRLETSFAKKSAGNA